MSILKSISALMLLLVSAATVHADNGKFALTEQRLDSISAGSVAVVAVADGSTVAVARTNVNSGALVEFGTGVSVSCCGIGSSTRVRTSGGQSASFSATSGLISVSFGVVYNY